MDLRQILEDFIPWIVLLALWIPAIKKMVKQRKQRTSEPFSTESTDTNHDFQEMFENFPPLAELPKPKKKKKAKKNVSQAPKPTVLPEEGVRAVADLKPMEPIDTRTRATGARRELRRAIVIGELLKRKY